MRKLQGKLSNFVSHSTCLKRAPKFDHRSLNTTIFNESQFSPIERPEARSRRLKVFLRSGRRERSGCLCSFGVEFQLPVKKWARRLNPSSFSLIPLVGSELVYAPPKGQSATEHGQDLHPRFKIGRRHTCPHLCLTSIRLFRMTPAARCVARHHAADVPPFHRVFNQFRCQENSRFGDGQRSAAG